MLRDYAERGYEPAFREIVTRHTDLVYSAALRRVESSDLACDVAQSVFTDLARKARPLADKMAEGSSLVGWLYRSTRFAALNQLRDDRRRLAHERLAMEQLITDSEAVPDWERVRPVLDEAMADLSDEDREALLLRYFKNHDFRAVGHALGVSDDAAQKRVSRAVERLREFFTKRGVTVGASGLVVVISANAVQAAPAGLAVTISTAAALAGTATATTATATATKAIAMTITQKLLVATVVVASIATPFVIQHQAQVKLREENQSLEQQLNQQAQLAAENERLSNLITETARTNSKLLPNDQLNELLRLRGEVGRLRLESRELARAKLADTQSPVNQLRRELGQMPEKNIPELQLLDDKKWSEDANKGKLDTEDGVRETLAKLRRAAKIRFVFAMGQAMENYVKAAGGQLPGNLSELKPYFNQPVGEAILQRYELLHTGKLSDLPSGEFLIAEKAAVDDQFDTLFKIGADNYTMQGVGKWSQTGSTNKWKF